jgi:hypothetical protein
LYSVCLAIENLWLASVAEGWGLGWVSFYREEFLSTLLAIPPGVRPLAWLCMGPVGELQQIPDLERHGWRARAPLEDIVHRDVWSQRGVQDVGEPSPGMSEPRVEGTGHAGQLIGGAVDRGVKGLTDGGP